MTELDQGRDQRGSPRRDFTVSLEVRWQGGEFRSTTGDVSLAGLFLETQERVPVGTPLRFEGMLEVDGDRRHLAGLGEVVRAVRPGEETDESPVAGLGVSIMEFFLGEAALTDALNEAASEVRAHTAQAEERRAPRIFVGIPALWGTTWPPEQEGYLNNVSSTGALVLTAADLPEPGTAIHVSLELPTGRELSSMRTLATVVRLHEHTPLEGHGMGIEFVRETPIERSFRRALGDEAEPIKSAKVPQDATPMDFSAMSARVEPPAPKTLETLSQTIQGAGGFRWTIVAKILGFALVAGALLWIGFVCMSSFAE
jgi:hypothetical protein